MLAPLSLVPALPPWVLGLTWAVGALGMGMTYSSLATLLLTYSPAGQQGQNSAALQVSDSSGVVLVTGLTGAMFAVSIAASIPGQEAFTAMYLVCAVIGVAAAVVSPRVRRGRSSAAPAGV
jgi:MFS family permease